MNSLVLSIPICLMVVFLTASSLLSNPTPMNCSDSSRLCTSFLAFKPSKDLNFTVVQSMFDVLPQDITVEGGGSDYVFVKKNCSCDARSKLYLTNTTYTMRSDEGLLYQTVMDAYEGMAVLPNSSRRARAGGVVNLKLICGCSNGLWNYLMTYVLGDGDSVASLASRFGVSMGNIESVNGISDPNNVSVGEMYYIPLNSAPGEPYSLDIDIPPALPPSPPAEVMPVNTGHKSAVSYRWLIGGAGIGLALIVMTVAVCICMWSSKRMFKRQESNANRSDSKTSHKFHILQRTSFCCGSGRYICGKSKETKPEESSERRINIPKALGTDVFDIEKPATFAYHEILAATDGFSDSSLLGHGTYGSVYYGVLHDQEVAIKKMTATKSQEFMVEMKVLCKVHHTNLVELMGYAASDQELFLIYEYAQKGSLKNHLHDPQSKGHTSLSWTMRLQIALDAARGLEYIHEHARACYVHRDIKTSNILLDEGFRAKISDFGLAKLVGKSGEGGVTATRVVGTYGLATTKSDVFAFGVILFEIISGREAVTRTEAVATKISERRSLASIMLVALRSVPDFRSMSSMKDYIDPGLVDLYPHDCLYKLAMVAKQCVDEDPTLRPDMKQVVISLSQILLSSIEWEATLSGNSQIFSGLVQGR
ncbi:hypothetical protein QQ045_008046 [Rhodiola kirilowii]